MTSGEVLLGHGGGGLLSMELIEKEVLTHLGSGPLNGSPDGVVLELEGNRLIFSTDSFVVQPFQFPGGDIGHLAVHGTVNDVAVAGGRPRWISLALILEEGLRLGTLRKVLRSIKEAAERCEVTVVTGDTKVVPRGQCDGMYINTSGLGESIAEFTLSPGAIQPGDAVLVSGTLGDHGMAVMAVRESLRLQNGPVSDTAPVHRLVLALRDIGSKIRLFRDPTRGGLAAILNEVVHRQSFGVHIEEAYIPSSPASRAVAEMLGLDLLHVASEGRVVAICDSGVSDEVLSRWRDLEEGQYAARIGTVTKDAGRVIQKTTIGTSRLVDLPHGELLPRIC